MVILATSQSNENTSLVIWYLNELFAVNGAFMFLFSFLLVFLFLGKEPWQEVWVVQKTRKYGLDLLNVPLILIYIDPISVNQNNNNNNNGLISCKPSLHCDIIPLCISQLTNPKNAFASEEALLLDSHDDELLMFGGKRYIFWVDSFKSKVLKYLSYDAASLFNL